MTPDERIKLLEDRLNKLEKSDRYVIEKNMQFLDGKAIQIGVTTGLKIGTFGAGPFSGTAIANPQKIGFFGATPIGPQQIPFPVTASDLYTALNAFELVLSHPIICSPTTKARTKP